MKIIKADENMTPTEVEGEYVDAVMSGNEDVAIEITKTQAEKMDLEDGE